MYIYLNSSCISLVLNSYYFPRWIYLRQNRLKRYIQNALINNRFARFDILANYAIIQYHYLHICYCYFGTKSNTVYKEENVFITRMLSVYLINQRAYHVLTVKSISQSTQRESKLTHIIKPMLICF